MTGDVSTLCRSQSAFWTDVRPTASYFRNLLFHQFDAFVRVSNTQPHAAAAHDQKSNIFHLPQNFCWNQVPSPFFHFQIHITYCHFWFCPISMCIFWNLISNFLNVHLEKNWKRRRRKCKMSNPRREWKLNHVKLKCQNIRELRVISRLSRTFVVFSNYKQTLSTNDEKWYQETKPNFFYTISHISHIPTNTRVYDSRLNRNAQHLAVRMRIVNCEPADDRT